MKLLLDTHIFLWLNAEPEKLSKNICDACENSGHLHIDLKVVYTFLGRTLQKGT